MKYEKLIAEARAARELRLPDAYHGPVVIQQVEDALHRLRIQYAIALAAMEHADELELAGIEL